MSDFLAERDGDAGGIVAIIPLALLPLLAFILAVPAAAPTATPPKPSSATLLAAGDIASCGSDGDEATAALIARIPGTVAALGDLAYERGSDEEFARCYAPTWGKFRARTRPAPGNHDYKTDGGAGYHRYFGSRAGPVGLGWYHYRLGGWLIVVLNSNCDDVGGCTAESPQGRWLRETLAANKTRCTLAYWHHARFSSGQHGDDDEMEPFWQALYKSGADVVLSGHDHIYERFAPQTPNGRPDSARGIRQFVVGTGGKNHYKIRNPAATSIVRNNDTFGILRLTLYPARYEFRFVPVAGGTFTDLGRATCH